MPTIPFPPIVPFLSATSCDMQLPLHAHQGRQHRVGGPRPTDDYNERRADNDEPPGFSSGD